MHVQIYVMHISLHMSLQNDCISNMFMLNLLHMKMKTNYTYANDILFSLCLVLITTNGLKCEIIIIL
jgi:hypothetical protein